MTIQEVLKKATIGKGYIARGIDCYAGHDQEYGNGWYRNYWIYANHTKKYVSIVMNSDVRLFGSLSRPV